MQSSNLNDYDQHLHKRPMKKFLLGIDIGTYSSKAVLTDFSGQILRTAIIAHGISTPKLGHVEHDALGVWWHDLKHLCSEIFDSPKYTSEEVSCVAISAIGPCLLPMDTAGNPLRPGILYGVDVRASQEVDELNAEFGCEYIFSHSRMALSSQAIGPKIRWLQKNEPHVWANTDSIGTATSFLIRGLTGVNCIDHHTASHYMPLYNPQSASWDMSCAEKLDVATKLPILGWSDQIAGHITQEAALSTGLRAGTPVTFGAVDALSEAVSAGVTEPGDLMIMYGSTTFFVLVQNRPTPSDCLWSTAGAHAGQFNLAAGMSTTGSITRWFKDQLARDLSAPSGYEELFSSVGKIPPGSGGLLVLPYFSGERTPINDPHARGVIAGLDLTHTREHLFKAALEGIGFGVRHNLETFKAIGAKVKRIVAVGGGAQSNIWPQIISDISGCSQSIPEITVGASYGNAFLAGCASGMLKRSDIRNWVRLDRVIEQSVDLKPQYDALYAVYLKLYQNTREINYDLASISSNFPITSMNSTNTKTQETHKPPAHLSFNVF